MTTANRAVPRIERIELPKDLVKILKEKRTTWLKGDKIWEECDSLKEAKQ
jgi:hypothetical protein